MIELLGNLLLFVAQLAVYGVVMYLLLKNPIALGLVEVLNPERYPEKPCNCTRVTMDDCGGLLKEKPRD